MSAFKQSTNALHAGYDPQAHQGAQAVPIYQTSSYVFENADDAAGRFNLSVPGYIYTRQIENFARILNSFKLLLV